MRSAAVSSGVLDASAIGVSGLCLIHCLSLPVLSVVLPVAGAFGEAEWVHQLFVLAAVPITAAAILQDRNMPGWRAFSVLASMGLVILAAAAFVEPLHDFETALTIVGAGLLAMSHVRRWRRRAYS